VRVGREEIAVWVWRLRHIRADPVMVKIVVRKGMGDDDGGVTTVGDERDEGKEKTRMKEKRRERHLMSMWDPRCHISIFCVEVKRCLPHGDVYLSLLFFFISLTYIYFFNMCEMN